MARFMRAIHVFAAAPQKKGVDGPDKPGHDGLGGVRFIPPETSEQVFAGAKNRALQYVPYTDKKLDANYIYPARIREKFLRSANGGGHIRP
jgi:hypothetical protein